MPKECKLTGGTLGEFPETVWRLWRWEVILLPWSTTAQPTQNYHKVLIIRCSSCRTSPPRHLQTCFMCPGKKKVATFHRYVTLFAWGGIKGRRLARWNHTFIWASKWLASWLVKLGDVWRFQWRVTCAEKSLQQALNPSFLPGMKRGWNGRWYTLRQPQGSTRPRPRPYRGSHH